MTMENVIELQMLVNNALVANERKMSNNGAKLWDTRNIPNGVYLYTLQAIGFSSTGKIIISK